MSYQGVIKNGQVTLPPDAVLPEGAAVRVDLVTGEGEFPEWSRELIKLVKERDWLADMARNHDHYLHGTSLPDCSHGATRVGCD